MDILQAFFCTLLRLTPAKRFSQKPEFLAIRPEFFWLNPEFFWGYDLSFFRLKPEFFWDPKPGHFSSYRCKFLLHITEQSNLYSTVWVSFSSSKYAMFS